MSLDNVKNSLVSWGAEPATDGYVYDGEHIGTAEEVAERMVNEGVIEEVGEGDDMFVYREQVRDAADTIAAILSEEFSLDEWQFDDVRHLLKLWDES